MGFSLSLIFSQPSRKVFLVFVRFRLYLAIFLSVILSIRFLSFCYFCFAICLICLSVFARKKGIGNDSGKGTSSCKNMIHASSPLRPVVCNTYWWNDCPSNKWFLFSLFWEVVWFSFSRADNFRQLIFCSFVCVKSWRLKIWTYFLTKIRKE